MKTLKTDPRHEKFRQAVTQTLQNFSDITPEEMLAVLAYTVGQLIALQDPTAVTREQVMEMVSSNIEAGNQRMVVAILMEERKEREEHGKGKY